MSDIIWETSGGQNEAERRPRTEGLSNRTHTRPVDTIDGWKKEIAACYATMQEFTYMDAIEVFQNLSQFSARASEMRSRISAQAGREETNFRTRIIDPFIEECDRQFKLHSRIQAINEMDARMAGGVRA